MKKEEKCTMVDQWIHPADLSSLEDSDAASTKWSRTSRLLLLFKAVGLIRQPHEAASRWQTLILLAWMAAPLVVILTWAAVNMESFLEYKDGAYYTHI
jgi:hypothetical protein